MDGNEEPLYSEGNSKSRVIPEWVRFMLEFGYRWPSAAGYGRRIAIISMPCDSHAFGLVSLGLIIRDMGKESANDMALHHRRLVRYARQYLQLKRQALQSQMHEYSTGSQPTGILHLIPSTPGGRRSKYRILDVTNDTVPGVVVELMQRQTKLSGSGLATSTVTQATSHRYTIENGPIVQVRSADTAIDIRPYGALLPRAAFASDSLRRSFSGLAIAGRPEGERPTRAMLEQVSFSIGIDRFTLGSLLRVEGWSTDQVSRSRFMNMRGKAAKVEQEHPPEIIVADGIPSFQKIYDAQDYKDSDLILIYPRTAEREQLEDLSSTLGRIDEFYTERPLDPSLALPQSIRVVTFEKG